LPTLRRLELIFAQRERRKNAHLCEKKEMKIENREREKREIFSASLFCAQELLIT
jgi:hypothetical protein